MTGLALGLVLLSAVAHAAWNFTPLALVGAVTMVAGVVALAVG